MKFVHISIIAAHLDAPVAQLDRALASGAKGRAFESRRVRQNEKNRRKGGFLVLGLWV